MARMYSRRRGQSGSTKPAKKVQPTWMRYKGKEIELLISKVAKEEKSPSKIGLIMRDSYGVPDVKMATGKSISKILEEKNLLGEIPEDLMQLIKKSVEIRKHLEENKKDQTAKRGLLLTESKVKKLASYYKKIGKISLEWKYDPKKARLAIE